MRGRTDGSISYPSFNYHYYYYYYDARLCDITTGTVSDASDTQMQTAVLVLSAPVRPGETGNYLA